MSEVQVLGDGAASLDQSGVQGLGGEVDSANHSGVHGLGDVAASANQTRVQGMGGEIDSAG